MRNRITKITILTFLITISIFSCTPPDSYILTKQAKLRIIERQDHQKCIAKGFDFGPGNNDWDDYTTEMYWRCRYNTLKDRLIPHAITSDAIANNAMIKTINEEILKRLNRAVQANLSKIEDDIETLDHSRCVSQGYNLDDINRTNINEYYLCRQRLVLDRIPPAPMITHTYEAAILPKKEFNKYIAEVSEVKISNSKAAEVSEAVVNKYPLCTGLNVKSDDFKKCVSAQEESKRCMASVEAVKIKKQLDDKIYCQQQAFIQFPDNYNLIKEKSPEEIAKIEAAKKAALESNNNNTLKFLNGEITRDVENAAIGGTKQAEREKETKAKLYNKIELLKLRDQFMNRCNKLMEEKLPDFAQRTAEDCLKIGSDWNKN